MAKRSETIKCNCPACGVGLRIDTDDLSILAVGDSAKKPVQPERSESPKQENKAPDNGTGSEKDKHSGSGEGEAPAEKETASAEGTAPDAEDPEQETEKESFGLGDW